MADPLHDLRLADIHTFLAVHRARSVTGASRSLGVTPSQVSKAIARLDDLLNTSLLLRVPRGGPVYTMNGQLVPVEDGCPLPRGRRRIGNEVQTIGLGLELAARTQQLIFGPVIAARSHVLEGSLVEVPVAGWSTRTVDTLYVFCN